MSPRNACLLVAIAATFARVAEAALARARSRELVKSDRLKSGGLVLTQARLESSSPRPHVSACGCSAPFSGGDAVEEANEVSRLAEEIEQAKRELNGWQLKLKREKEYHDQQTKRLEKQFLLRKAASSTGFNNTDDVEARYVRHMCALFVEARMMPHGKEKELELQKLCMGRTSLALLDFDGGSSISVVGSDVSGCPCFASIAGARRSSLLAQSRLVVATTASPVEQMKERSEKLKEAVIEARDRYWSEPETWRQERMKLNAQEDELGEAFEAAHNETEKAKKEAWASVRATMCGLINGGADVETVVKACPKV
eukprot:TRINITY_DN74998_c0_g1_i1.p1 TRINITY_DN74998_c0_g1~~TRINITY_DN74998_c0_g1_i1.p1  ORF type:complete len:332 (-),score=83.01 TRINITY_DN74998_c0_g1_i1:211-1149(-)